MSLIEVTIRAFGTQIDAFASDSIVVGDVLASGATKQIVVSESLVVDEILGDVQDILSDIEFVVDPGINTHDTGGFITSFNAPPQTLLPVSSPAFIQNPDVALNGHASAGVFEAAYSVGDMSNETEGEIFWVSYGEETSIGLIDYGMWNLGGGLRSVFPGQDVVARLSFGSTTRRDITAILEDDFSTPHIWNIRAKADEWVMTRDGVSIHQDLVNTVSFPSAPYVFSDIVDGYFQGQVGIMVCCNKVQTPARRAAMLDYMSRRFGIPVTAGAFGISYERSVSDSVGSSSDGASTTLRTVVVSDSIAVSDVASAIPGIAIELDVANVTVTTGKIEDWGGKYSQSNSTKRAVYSASDSDFNGQPSAAFSGAQEYSLGDISAFTAVEMFAVLKLNNDPPLVAANTGLQNISGGGGASHYPWTDGSIYDAFASSVRHDTIGNPSINLAVAHIYSPRSKSGEWTLEINGVQQFTTATNTVSVTAAATFGTDDGSYWFDGKAAYILYCNQVQTTAARAEILAYLAARFGISI